jgi:nitrous oxide reductase accessory protein NosL
MRNRLSLLGLVLLLAIVASACAKAEASGPPDIKYGRDICVQCGMIVSEAKFAAAYTTPDGTKLSFDDVGDLLLHQRAADDPIDVNEAWVHDYETEAWVTVDEAFFVPTMSVSTPMGHSIISFADEVRADTFARDVDGEVIVWDVVLRLPTTNGLVGDHHMGHGQTDNDEMSSDDMVTGEMDHDTMDSDEMHSDADH